MLPDFLLIGATKGGTTTLFSALAGHKQVWLHPTKELRFFTKEHRFQQGPAWYAGQFEAARNSGALVVGEASNAYTRHPVYAGVPERIASLRPEMKLVYLIRDPMRRLESHYRHRLVTGIEWRSPSRAFREDPRYLAASLYGEQIARYLRVFPPAQLFVARSEDLFAQPRSVLEPLARFLGIDAAHWPEPRAENVTAERLVAPALLRQLIRVRWARKSMMRVAYALPGLPLRAFLKPADAVEFALDDKLRAELQLRFDEDRALLERLPRAIAGSNGNGDLQAPVRTSEINSGFEHLSGLPNS